MADDQGHVTLASEADPRAMQIQDSANESASVLQMIERASRDPTVDVDKFERMLAMAERVNAQSAERAFNAAMSAVKKQMPQVLRNAENDHSKAKYATLDAVSSVMDPIISEHGFALSFGTADCPKENHYRLTCLVSHAAGYTRPYFYDLPIDAAGSQGKANKTAIQASGSTISYGRRYLKLMIFDVTLTNGDDDGNGGRGKERARLSQAQIGQLEAKIELVGASKAAFMAYLGVPDLESIWVDKFDDAIRALDMKKRAQS